MIESGVPGYEAYVWMGLLAPKGTPPPIVDKINRDVLAVLASDEVKTYMAQRRHRDRRLDAGRVRRVLPRRARSVGEGRARDRRQGRLSTSHAATAGDDRCIGTDDDAR